MLFNSLEFAIFLPVLFILYWVFTNHNRKLQNLFLLVGSYIFYGWWDWRFLSLIFISSLVDFVVGLSLGHEKKSLTRKVLLFLSIAVNIGFLLFFKYSNFFIETFIDSFSLFGRKINPISLQIVLPVGISFYTFQTLSYSIDVYNRKINPTRDFIAFFAFVSFFPQLVAGPIERAKNLLPQFSKARFFNYEKAVDGMRQILWGLFKKMVIADNCAIYVNEIFANYSTYSGLELLLGAIFFAFQIYADFSGYSDIAIGTAGLFGHDLMTNFSYPYFSRDIAEFWRRWHISLTTWFRDYLYIPLGGSRCNTVKKIRNIFIIFMVSGLWHGANWTFVIWGILNACYFLPYMLLKKNRDNLNTVSEGLLIPSLKDVLQMSTTFLLIAFSWIFFRAETLSHALLFIQGIVINLFEPVTSSLPLVTCFLIAILFVIEWMQRNKIHAMYFTAGSTPRSIRWAGYILILFIIFCFVAPQQDFIYFQF